MRAFLRLYVIAVVCNLQSCGALVDSREGPGLDCGDNYGLCVSSSHNTATSVGNSSSIPFSSSSRTSTGREYAKPRNIIILLRDGGGHRQLQAFSLYASGQLLHPEYEKFPLQLAASTYAHGGSYLPQEAARDASFVLSGFTDSGAASTALSTGVRTHLACLGLGPSGEKLLHLSARANQMGKEVGLVTDGAPTHATPAGMAIHVENRNLWSSIAQAMWREAPLRVLMGAGHPEFDNNGVWIGRQMGEASYFGGWALWDSLRAGQVQGVEGLWTMWENRGKADSLAQGLINPPNGSLFLVAPVANTLQILRTDSAPIASVPSLATMAMGALRVLEKSPEGFFLLVEGGAIDVAGHGNFTELLLEAEEQFFNAMVEVIAWVEEKSSWEESLVLVISDHETGYLTPPGAIEEVHRKDLDLVGTGQIPAMQWNSGGHTNQLVPFFARGVGVEIFFASVSGYDAKWGWYLHLADIGKALHELWKD